MGPQAAATLADMGADVIKIELPVVGDLARRIFCSEEDLRSAFYDACNRGKRGMTLDLREPKGVEVFKRLVKSADVVVSNWSILLLWRFPRRWRRVDGHQALEDELLPHMKSIGNYCASFNTNFNGNSNMNMLPKLNATPVLLAFSLSLVLTIPGLSAEPMHTPTKMPMARAESVGMSTEVLSRIDEMMQDRIDAGHIQGGATIVARRGKVVHFSTHGEMDVEKGRAMEPDALYIMASSAKPVIGVATLMLVDEGLISLSDPISKFIPEFANQKVAVPAKPSNGDGKKEWSKGKGDNKGKKWDKGKGKANKGKGDVPAQRLVPLDTPLTIHHLLTHTSGLTSGGIEHTKEDTLATYVPKLSKAPLIFQPGTRWVYGNVGIHAVLPRIIEIVSETPFHEFMQERVFNPLEMNNTYFNLPSEKVSKLILRDDYKNKGGGFVSAAEDFLHFEQMLLNGGELFGRRLLSPASVKMMSSNQVGDLFATSGKGEKAQKGMGFGYAVAVTLDPIAAANGREKGAFGWGGAAGTVSWTDPKNELVGVLMLQQPRGGGNFAKIVLEAIIE